MPRQRKPQNGGQRLWTWRVANTTTGSTTTQAVYRIPTGKRYGECDVLAYEVLGTSPISVAIEWENVYRISLDTAALENVIESMNLDLSNVTLQTINGNVEFTGSITADWTFTWTTVTASTVEATTWNITNIAASDVTTTALTATSASIDWLTVTNNATVGGTLWVTWAISGNSTLSVAWNIAGGADLSIVWTASVSWISATTWDITTLSSTSLTAWAAEVTNWLTVAGWINSDTLETSWNVIVGGNETITGNLSVGWTSTFTGDITAQNFSAEWTTSLKGTSIDGNVTVSGNSTTSGNASVGWNMSVAGTSTLTGDVTLANDLTVAGNSTVTGNSTTTGNSTFNGNVNVAKDLTVSGDATITDDLTVNGSTHLKAVETTGSVDITWTLRTSGAAVIGNGVTVTGQVESDSVVTTNTVTDNLTVNGNIVLWNDATASDFVLQSEKGQPNGVAPLNVNGLIDTQYLPPVYTTAVVKMWTGVFSNSDTSVVVDADITSDSFVVISNYQDIVWDLNETISVWQITVVSNHTETWSYKYIIVNSLS